jgi:hypothetical protein
MRGPVPSGRTKVAVGVFSGALAVSALAVGVPAAQASGNGVTCLGAAAGGAPQLRLQRAFRAAARTYRVPESVLLGVSYLESRWDDHAGGRSTAGGYGPLDLTDVKLVDQSSAKGDGGTVRTRTPVFVRTLPLASALTGLSRARLIADPAANVCGGAAVLASLQRARHRPTGAGVAATSWAGAIGAYSGTGADSAVFVRQVFRVVGTGAHRTTINGQRMRLVPNPAARAWRAPTSGSSTRLDCPTSLACEWIPAPYEWYGAPDPGAYGNHDLANRPNDLKIKYIVIHDTEATYDTTIGLVQDPTYVSWHYTIRSNDGHVAEHVRPHDVAWHAGNWYVNMHSIGIEHEGFAADASWYTESMYESSAALVTYLANRFQIPLDRAHIIGHDQVPGTIPSTVAGMHWDPGPYWDWEHYFRLLGAPIGGGATDTGWHGQGVYTVRAGYADNIQPVTGCVTPGTPCADHGTNFVYVHTAPASSAPLVADIGLHADGSPSTTAVDDIGARLAAGQRVVAFARSGDWVGVWYLGQPGWIYSPRSHPVLVGADARTVTALGRVGSAPIYGRAYPEQSAYPSAVPYQTVTPLQYSLPHGQAYVLADASVPTDYYYATTFPDGPYQRTDIRGQDRYYEIYFGHRLAFVRAADVRIR